MLNIIKYKLIFNILYCYKLLNNIKGFVMRAGFVGIAMGVSTAMALRNEYKLTSQVVTISLVTEIITIIIFGLVDIS